MGGTTMTIEFSLNGRAVSADVGTHQSTIEIQQGSFGLTGVRESCGQKLCGCSTVLIDGAAVTGCLYLAAMAEGNDVRTIESVDAHGALSAGQ